MAARDGAARQCGDRSRRRHHADRAQGRGPAQGGRPRAHRHRRRRRVWRSVPARPRPRARRPAQGIRVGKRRRARFTASARYPKPRRKTHGKASTHRDCGGGSVTRPPNSTSRRSISWRCAAPSPTRRRQVLRRVPERRHPQHGDPALRLGPGPRPRLPRHPSFRRAGRRRGRHVEKLEALGAKCFARRPEGQQGFYETKFHGPDKVLFDITDHPWRGSAPLGAGEAAPKAADAREGDTIARPGGAAAAPVHSGEIAGGRRP